MHVQIGRIFHPDGCLRARVGQFWLAVGHTIEAYSVGILWYGSPRVGLRVRLYICLALRGIA